MPTADRADRSDGAMKREEESAAEDREIRGTAEKGSQWARFGGKRFVATQRSDLMERSELITGNGPLQDLLTSRDAG